VLNWGLQRTCAVIPRSANPERQAENFGAGTFQISKEEVDEIATLNNNSKICNKYAWMFGYDIYA